MHPRTLAGAALAVSLSVLVTGCLERFPAPIRPHVGFAQRVQVGIDGFRDVDLLIIVDDSGSMEIEQQNLAARIEELVEYLADPDEDGDGEPDHGAAASIHIAVATTDLGLGGATVERVCSPRGRDGMLVTNAACGASEGVQRFVEGDDPAAIAGTVACMVDGVGTSGCGLEQQLGAATRAMEQGLPVGFPRESSVFAVLVLTDEEDCSLADPTSFFSGVDLSGSGDVICQRTALGQDGRDPRWLVSPADIAARLRGDRPENAFIFTAIAGIPPELSGRPAAEILADGRMAYGERLVPTPSGGSRLSWSPVCTQREPSGDTAEAAPGIRIVQTAAAIPGASVHSICTDDFRPAVEDLANRIAAALDGACLARRVPTPDDGVVQCIVTETLPVGARCIELAARSLVPAPMGDTSGRERCEVEQAPPGSGRAGWFYDGEDSMCGRISYTDGAEPPLGTTLTVDCYFEVEPGGSGTTTP